MAVRDYLREHGIERTFHGVQALLASRIVLGELHFGESSNLTPTLRSLTRRRGRSSGCAANAAPREVRAAARPARCPALRHMWRADGDRPTDQAGKRHYLQVLHSIGDCPRRVTISAGMAERVVVQAVQHTLEGVTGIAGVEHGTEDAERELHRAELVSTPPGPRSRSASRMSNQLGALVALREERDQARERVDELRRALVPAVTVSAGDRQRLTIDEQRDLIRAVVDRATSCPAAASSGSRFICAASSRRSSGELPAARLA